MTIRPGTAGDLDALLRMTAQFVYETSYRGQVTPHSGAVSALVSELLANGLVLVAECHDGVVVGMLGATLFTHPVSGERTATEIAWWVDPEHRTHALAREMWTAYEAWALGQGATVIQGTAPAGSKVGALYRRAGYAELETTWQRRVA